MAVLYIPDVSAMHISVSPEENYDVITAHLNITSDIQTHCYHIIVPSELTEIMDGDKALPSIRAAYVSAFPRKNYDAITPHLNIASDIQTRCNHIIVFP